VLALAGALLVRVVRPLQHVNWFPLRHAVISFRRPGNQTRVVLLAVGLGAFFIIGVRALQANLVREFSFGVRADSADLFLIDIQPDQRDAVDALLREENPGRAPKLIPVMRARVTGVEGQRLNLDGVEDVRGRGSLAREYTVTFRPGLEANERVVDGTFWPAAPSEDLEVSIEASLRERFGFAIGDRVRFDILGREVQARVTSVREVEWADTRAGGFMFVFRPGPLDRAPHTYIASLRGPDTNEARARLQRNLVARFPNVSAIDVREVARTVEGVLDNITLAITMVGGVALFSGLLIVVGSVAMTKFQRLHEAAIFKTLGAGTATMAAMLALEYSVLGLLAGTVGALASMGLTWAVCRLLLDIRWSPEAGVVLGGLLLTAVLVGLVGVASSLDVLRRRPLSILRAG
jgi:putative ABC transport system permease protein